jgi:hypothetical protein
LGFFTRKHFFFEKKKQKAFVLTLGERCGSPTQTETALRKNVTLLFLESLQKSTIKRFMGQLPAAAGEIAAFNASGR